MVTHDSLLGAKHVCFLQTPWLYQLQLHHLLKEFYNYVNISSLLIKQLWQQGIS